jgi:hypothetical protein
MPKVLDSLRWTDTLAGPVQKLTGIWLLVPPATYGFELLKLFASRQFAVADVTPEAKAGRSLNPRVTLSGVPSVTLYGEPDCAKIIGLAEILYGSGMLPPSIIRLRTPNPARP